MYHKPGNAKEVREIALEETERFLGPRDNRFALVDIYSSEMETYFRSRLRALDVDQFWVRPEGFVELHFRVEGSAEVYGILQDWEPQKRR